jgi:dTDP-4-amino-4,6-dideoxygalactose transaminase
VIPLHRPWFDTREEAAVLRVLRSGQLAGNGDECAALERDLQARLGASHVLALSSATHALELAMQILGVADGEVIVPSFTFPSVGSAIVKAGGRIRFCEVRQPDLNVDLEHARSLVGPSTRALVITHYAGHPQIVDDFPVPIIEDSAHALGSRIGDRFCGTLGRFGCLSFHATKNLVAGEGGAFLTSDPDAVRTAQVIREKGTNRDEFRAGRVDHYAWVSVGSSLVMPELSAALLRVQLAKIDAILDARRGVASLYDAGLADLEREGKITVVRPVGEVTTSHHIYAILVDPAVRRAVVTGMAELGIQVASHFVPLHGSPYGRRMSDGVSLPRTERLASSVVRLPIYPGLSDEDAHRVVDALRRALSR